MSQTDYNDEIVTWYIDRTPDRSIVLHRRFLAIEEPESYAINVETLRNFTGGDRIYARELYPFGNPAGRNRVNSSPVNFILQEFELSEEDKTCCICMEQKENEQICSINCRHKFCVVCIDLHLNRNQYCPLCRAYIHQIQTQTIEARRQIHH